VTNVIHVSLRRRLVQQTTLRSVLPCRLASSPPKDASKHANGSTSGSNAYPDLCAPAYSRGCSRAVSGGRCALNRGRAYDSSRRGGGAGST